MAESAKLSIRWFESSPMLQTIMVYLITFFALFFTDLVYTYYLRAVSNDQTFTASFWAAMATLLASVAVINYTSDNWQLIPAILGAFTGTWVGMKWKFKKATVVE